MVKPWRGAQVATGVVLLVVACGLVTLEPWEDAVHLAYLVPALSVTALLAVAAPVGDDGVRPWHAVLYAGTWTLAGLTAWRGLEVAALGVRTDDARFVTLLAATLVLVALPFGRAPAMTLLGWLAVTAAAPAGLFWVSDPGDGLVRWLLLMIAAAATLAAVARRDRRPAHARAVAGAGGVAVLGIAALPAADLAVPEATPAWWLSVLLAAGFGQVAYGCVDAARGSVALGVAALGAFVLLAGPGSWTWVALLGAGSVAFLALGLRPARPLPPPPVPVRDGPAIVPLRPPGG